MKRKLLVTTIAIVLLLSFAAIAYAEIGSPPAHTCEVCKGRYYLEEEYCQVCHRLTLLRETYVCGHVRLRYFSPCH